MHVTTGKMLPWTDMESLIRCHAVVQNGPYTSKVDWGKSLSIHLRPWPPWSFTEATWALSQPLAAKAAHCALSPFNSCSRRRCGKEESGQRSEKEMRRGDGVGVREEQGEGRRRSGLLSPFVALSMANLSFSSVISLLSGLSGVEFPVFSCTHYKVLGTEEYWTWSSVNLANFSP